MRDDVKKIITGVIILILSTFGFIAGIFIWKNNYDHVQCILYLSIMGIISSMGVFILSYGIRDLYRNTSSQQYDQNSIIVEDDDFN